MGGGGVKSTAVEAESLCRDPSSTLYWLCDVKEGTHML